MTETQVASAKKLMPVGILEWLLEVNPAQGKFILTGLGVFAAAAIVASLQVDMNTTGRVAGYLIGFALLVYVVAFTVTDKSMRKVLGWFTITVAMVFGSAVVVTAMSASAGARLGLNPSYCLLRPFRSCEEIEREMALNNPPTAIPPTVAKPSQPVDPSRYQVSVNFGGIISRDAVREVVDVLKSDGWRVIEPTSGGGVRTAEAYGRNEVVYSTPDGEGAAQEIARRFQEARLVGEQITMRRDAALAPGALQVWLSRLSTRD
jgi:hypothetical protein